MGDEKKCLSSYPQNPKNTRRMYAFNTAQKDMLEGSAYREVC